MGVPRDSHPSFLIITMRFWSFFTLGAVIVAISLYRIVPPLSEPGYFTEFGAGFMIGNVILLFGGLAFVVLAWRRRKAA